MKRIPRKARLALLLLSLSALSPHGLPPDRLVLLALLSLIGGIGITTIGPGGILVTIGLFAFTNLSPAEVAGTAIVTHVGTGLVGSLSFLRSGQLRDRPTRRLALALSAAALLGAPVGVVINSHVSGRQFGVMLAVFVSLVGLSVVVREVNRRHANDEPHRGPEHAAPQAAIGAVVAVVSGMFGLGGPMIAVPILALAGFPLLTALAAAQAQSIVVASAGTAAYLVHGAISWPLAALTGAPEMIGVWLGWKTAHRVPARPLTYAMAAVLIALGPVLIARQ